MSHWFYVQGTERVGPVNADVLQDLFQKDELNPESYVWKKGFQNWERIKDVNELQLKKSSTNKTELNSPELQFHFNLLNIKEDQEEFFIKIGVDRNNKMSQEIFGPYSLKEIIDAFAEKRMNNKTLTYAAGMPGWVEVKKILMNTNDSLILDSDVKENAPLLLVIENQTQPIIGLIKKAGLVECQFLSSDSLNDKKTIFCSLYHGANLKIKNIKADIVESHAKSQTTVCRFIELSEDAKRILQNHVS